MSPPSRRHTSRRQQASGAAGHVSAHAVEKVEGFIKQLAADRVVVIVRGGGLCFIDFD